MNFEMRLLLLFAFLGALALWDRWRRGAAAERPREWRFILATAVLGAIYGLVHDAITVSISSEYFIVGKGLAAGEGLTLRALSLGAESGCGAGLAGGAILLYVGRSGTRPSSSYRALGRGILGTLIAAAVGAVLAGIVRPVDLLGWGHPGVTDEALPTFRQVWGIHIGSYLGLATGLLIAAIRLHVARQECDL